MPFRITNRDAEPLTVVFEPWGSEFVLAPGDYLTVEWPTGFEGGLEGGIDYAPGTLTVSEPSGGATRLWNSQGEELSILG